MYEFIAAALHRSKPDPGGVAITNQWLDDCIAIGEAIQQQQCDFNIAQFYAACGI